MTSTELIKIHFSVHGLIAGKVLRLNTRVQLHENATLTELLEIVGPQIGVDILTPLKKGGENPVILLGGKNLELPAGLEQQLQDGDEIAILQALAGG